MKRPREFSIAVERGRNGASLAWCLELPGCATLLAADDDPLQQSRLALAEFIAWSHQRSAQHADLNDESVSLAQVLETGADVVSGESTAFFLHDGEPANGGEFPAWANAHDLALDQFRELVSSLPPRALEVYHGEPFAAATRFELDIAASLGARMARVSPGAPGLNDAHLWLQQAICDAPAQLRIRQQVEGKVHEEEWSVRKAMRLSIWHLRYQTAAVRRSLQRIWLPG